MVGMLHSEKELQELQSYPLYIKEQLTFQRIRELCDKVGSEGFYVSFSGGKDSEVAVDFAARSLKKIGYTKLHVLNINTGLEYLSVQKFCEPFCKYVSEKYDIDVNLDIISPHENFAKIIELYGYPIISKEVSQCIREARKGIINADGTYQYRLDKLNGEKKNKDGSLSQYNMSRYKFLLDIPCRVSEQCCKKTKKDPAKEYESRTGRICMVATCTEESRLRKSKWLKHGCNAFDLKRPTSAPFSFWCKNDMLEYIHEEHMPIADAYGKVVAVNNTGIDGQMDMFDILGGPCKYCTTGCSRTGCLYCLFGITQDPDRFLRLQKIEPKRAAYVLGGGQFDDDGYWIPSKKGLGLAFILDWIHEHGGIDIPYNK